MAGSKAGVIAVAASGARLLPNPALDRARAYGAEERAILSLAGAMTAATAIRAWDGYKPTPVRALATLAAENGVAALFYKDEGKRFGLKSFKAMGGAYAVERLVAARGSAAGLTVTCATDGNHGRSVAQGAELVGARAAIFVHSGVSDNRVAAIARFGAEMIRVEGNYDESVAEAARVAAERGWTTVSDTSWPGYERIPGLVMQGYTAIPREALRQLDRPPTHVFVQAGVGGVAAALAGHLAILLGETRPTFVVVDPARAACLYETARAGHPVKVPHGEPTVMAMLECYEPSLVAWRVLSRAADGFMTVDEAEAVAVMNRLAHPAGRDPAIVAGESGGVGLAGLIQAAENPEARVRLGLDAASRVLLINTEGATDPERYALLVPAAAANRQSSAVG